MNCNPIRRLLWGVLSTAILGCSTPAPVLDLSSQGVVILAKAESELESFVAYSNHAYAQRLASVKRMSSSDIEAQSAVEFESYTAQRAGMHEQVALVKLFRELSDERKQARERGLKQQAELEKTLAVGDPIKIPKERLAQAKKAFAVLSQELSREEWLKFTLGYGKQVNDSLKKSEEKATQAKTKAEGEDKKQREKGEAKEKKTGK